MTKDMLRARVESLLDEIDDSESLESFILVVKPENNKLDIQSVFEASPWHIFAACGILLESLATYFGVPPEIIDEGVKHMNEVRNQRFNELVATAR